MKRISIFEELNREKQKAEHYKKEADEWQKKYSEIEKKFKELEKKFNQLLNSNTPTSNIPSYLKQYSIIRPERGSNKRGKPKGGNGGSRKAPKHHDEKVEAKAKSCPQCNSRKIKKKDKYSFTVYDFPILKLIKRLATIFVYCCKEYQQSETLDQLRYESQMGCCCINFSRRKGEKSKCYDKLHLLRTAL